jgi:hypothetical protein
LLFCSCNPKKYLLQTNAYVKSLVAKTDTIISSPTTTSIIIIIIIINLKQHQQPNQNKNLLTTVSKLLKNHSCCWVIPLQNLGHFENPFGRESFGRSWVG